MSQLFADCLNEIFEYLEEDKVTLRSCLLVNRLWCEVSVRILWRRIRNYNTLIACLPKESIDILSKNGINTSTSASKPPMFNYISFCKFLSFSQVSRNIRKLLKNQQSISPQDLNDNLSVIVREILKFLITQASLKTLYFYPPLLNISSFTFPVIGDCLKNLSVLDCRSDICPEFFRQLSQTSCHNIQLLAIEFVKVISNGLADLISVQQNLKHLHIIHYNCEHLTVDIINSLAKLPNTLIKLEIYGEKLYIPLSFISNLTRLQTMILSHDCWYPFDDFVKLQHVTFSQLQVLKFQYEHPRNESI